jgi:hypothetical protein
VERSREDRQDAKTPEDFQFYWNLGTPKTTWRLGDQMPAVAESFQVERRAE